VVKARKIIQTYTTESMQHFPTLAQPRHVTARHTLHQLAAASPCGHSTVNFTKPLILHGKIINYFSRTRYYATKFNYLHHSYYLKPQTETKAPTGIRLTRIEMYHRHDRLTNVFYPCSS
jgi:hypothetical protein